jgi:hypothetical protein
MDYENIIFFISPNQIFILKIYLKINIQKNKTFQHIFMGNFDNFLKGFHINK